MVYPKATPSYPSGHTTFAYVMAILLANMVPEKSVAIFDRAASYGYNRVVVGAHFPTDVEAGRIAGTVIDSVFLHEPRFLTDSARRGWKFARRGAAAQAARRMLDDNHRMGRQHNEQPPPSHRYLMADPAPASPPPSCKLRRSHRKS